MTSATTIASRLKNAAVSAELIAERVGVVKKYINALNTANIDAVTSIFSEDAVVFDPLGSHAVSGATEIHDFFVGGPFLHPIKAALDGEVRVAGNSAAFAFTAFSDGKEMHIIDVFEFNTPGKVSKMVAYWSHANVTAES